MTDSTAPLVIDLLDYIEQVEKLKSKPPFSVPTEFFVAYQHELKGLPALDFNLQDADDDVWLKIPRLQESPPPEPDERLKPWITLPKSLEKQPELKQESVVTEGKKEVSRSKLSDFPNIPPLFDAYVRNQWEPWAAGERPRR